MKKHLQKIIASIMLVLCVNFITPTYSHAIDVGGILVKPISALTLLALDGVMAVMDLFIGWSNTEETEINNDAISDKIDSMSDPNTYNDIRTDPEDSSTELTLQGLPTGETIDEEEGNVANNWVSMEDFFLGNIQLTDINIFQSNSSSSIVGSIRQIIADWYVALRNLAGVALLCGIIYIAIRTLLSSIADEKAHYKEMLFDWFKSACLVVFVHVLMILILNICDFILNILSSTVPRYGMLAFVRGNLASSWDTNQIGYIVLYAMLIYYTFVFSIAYLKRFFYTMLLILMAPIVSLMYGFGQHGKGIFDRWIKEFTCNAFLQPYHLLIYTILFGWISGLLEIGKNDFFVVILAVIVAHFIRDAEKYYRMIFGIQGFAADQGSYESGNKVVKDIQHKVADVAKATVSVAAAFIPVGGLISGAANTATKNAATMAGDGAQNIGNVAQGVNRQAGGTLPPGNNNIPTTTPTPPTSPIPPNTPTSNMPQNIPQTVSIPSITTSNGDFNNVDIETDTIEIKDNEDSTIKANDIPELQGTVVDVNNVGDTNIENVENNNNPIIEENTVNTDTIDKTEIEQIETKDIDIERENKEKDNLNNSTINISNAAVDMNNSEIDDKNRKMDLSLDKSSIENAVDNIRLGNTSNQGAQDSVVGLKRLNEEDQQRVDALNKLGRTIGAGNSLGNAYMEETVKRQLKSGKDLTLGQKVQKGVIQADLLINGDDKTKNSSYEPVKESKNNAANSTTSSSSLNSSNISVDGKEISKEIERAIDKSTEKTGKQHIEVDANVVAEAVSKEVKAEMPQVSKRENTKETISTPEAERNNMTRKNTTNNSSQINGPRNNKK